MNSPSWCAPAVERARRPSVPGLSRRELLATVPAVALGVALGGCSDSSGTDAGDRTRSTGTVSTTAPKGSTADSKGSHWPVYGHDHSQTRANLAESRITRSTVARLAKAWEIPDLVGVTGTPTVVDGVAYFADWQGAVWAVEADTGAKVWTAQIGGMIVGAPAVDGDRVYASSGSRLFGLDRATGESRWEATTDSHPQAQISASPVVVDGIVLQGTGQLRELLPQGRVPRSADRSPGTTARRARSAGSSTPPPETRPQVQEPASGRPRPSTSTAGCCSSGPARACPSRPRRWPTRSSRSTTGPARSSGPRSSPIRTSSPPANPTGKDADVGASPNLWTSDGRDLVGAGDKGGTFHALDRETGKVVWETQLTPGSAFGGEIGSAAFVDGRLVASSNVGDPKTNAPTNVTHVFGLDPGDGQEAVDVGGARREDLRPGQRRPGRRLRRHRHRQAPGPRHRHRRGDLDGSRHRPRRPAARRSSTAACCGATASSSSADPVRAASSPSRWNRDATGRGARAGRRARGAVACARRATPARRSRRPVRLDQHASAAEHGGPCLRPVDRVRVRGGGRAGLDRSATHLGWRRAVLPAHRS